jgi:hypothetical protein
MNLFRYLREPRFLLIAGLRGICRIVPDKFYIRLNYRLLMGRKLNLKYPKLFSEKLQWLKLYDRDPRYIEMVDKVEAKVFAEKIIGGDFIVPTIGIWSKAEDIDFSTLPLRFVLKTTHDSGGVVICKDKSTFNTESARDYLNHRLKRNVYSILREWPYKGVKPRILAEEYLEDGSCGELRDFKFFCFDGEPKVMFIVSGRPDNTCASYYDMEFNLLPFSNGYKTIPIQLSKPDSFDKMKELATCLSKGIPQVRIDFYNVSGRIYFGEITFYDGGGTTAFEPSDWDAIMGSMINLPQNKKN